MAPAPPKRYGSPGCRLYPQFSDPSSAYRIRTLRVESFPIMRYFDENSFHERSVRPSSLFSMYSSCVYVQYLCRERGGGEGRRKIRRKNGGPFTLLKYVATAYFLIPRAKLLPLTMGPKKGWKDEGYYVFSLYFLLLLRLTD
jgi:hypothetical protein